MGKSTVKAKKYKENQKQVLRYLTASERNSTRAVWAASNMRASVNLYFMAYADHAKKSLDQSPSVPRNLFEAAEDFDLIDEARQNKELHASMDFMRILLKKHQRSRNADDVVEPKVRVVPPKGGYKKSPLEYAKEMTDIYKPLGEWMTHVLEAHQSTLEYLKFPFTYIAPQDARDMKP